MNIGADTYLEVEYLKAIEIIDRNLTLLNKKKILLEEQIIKNKAYNKYIRFILDQIKSNNLY